jgi:hypothetical protein
MSTKTKIPLPIRHHNKIERKTANGKADHSLASIYELRSLQDTSDFIDNHPGVSSALLSLKAQIEASFGNSVSTLEAISDPEESSERLRIQILTSLPPRVALRALDTVESKWLAIANRSISDLFLLTVAPE